MIRISYVWQICPTTTTTKKQQGGKNLFTALCVYIHRLRCTAVLNHYNLNVVCTCDCCSLISKAVRSRSGFCCPQTYNSLWITVISFLFWNNKGSFYELRQTWWRMWLTKDTSWRRRLRNETQHVVFHFKVWGKIRIVNYIHSEWAVRNYTERKPKYHQKMAEYEILLWNTNAYFCLSLPGALWGMCAVCFTEWTFSRLQQTCLNSPNRAQGRNSR